MFKNVASQKIALFAFDYTTGAPKTGDAANLTFYVNKDWGGLNALADTSASELSSTNAPGWYVCDVSQSETNADALHFTGKSSTSNVVVVGQMVYTRPPNFTSLTISGGKVPATIAAGDIATNAVDAAALKADAVAEIQSGLSTLDAAAVRSAVGLASANLDTQIGTLATAANLATVAGYIDTEVAAIKTKTDNLPASPAAVGDIPSAASIAAAVWATAIEGTKTALQMMRGMTAVLLGKASGMATTTATFRDTEDAKNRVTATVDENGNRSAVTLDLS